MIGKPSATLLANHAIRRHKQAQEKAVRNPDDSWAQKDLEFWEAETIRRIENETRSV